MRLKSVYISQYKNLRDFSLTFDGDSFIDVFVGKNATGKSNLFEALIEIFRHLYEYDNEKEKLDFNYRLNFEINNKETEIAWTSGQFKVNGRERKNIDQKTLPDNVLIYYSGHNDTVKRLVKKYEEDFRKRIKKADLEESRRFIGIGSEYKELLLALLLLQPQNNKARQFILQKLRIKTIAPEFDLILRRPSFADKKIEIEDFNQKTHYWGAVGITREFLDKLVSCVKGEFNHRNIYNSESDTYRIPVNTELFQSKVEANPAKTFRQFDNLKTLDMLAEISIPLTIENGIAANISHFSDGQFQSVYIYSIIEIFKDRNCITLLDEPDSFLHPEWQFAFLKQVIEITDIAAQNNHVLMSSHSASTLCSFDAQNISLFKIDNSKVSCSKRSKKEIINELSNSFIQYSEDESKLLIDNVIRSSLRPILFVEGPTDVSILNTAFTMLYPDIDIPFLIQDAFDRGFIRTILARNEVFSAYPDKHFFALFDFYDAYDDWRDLGGEQIVPEIGHGLCRKLPNKNAHAFLLPVSDNQLRAQVWDESNPIEKIRSKPHFCIEHIFWDVQGLDIWFRHDDKTGMIVFKGDKHKVKFAKEVVPTLSADCFEVFRPMFEFIRSKSPIS